MKDIRYMMTGSQQTLNLFRTVVDAYFDGKERIGDPLCMVCVCYCCCVVSQSDRFDLSKLQFALPATQKALAAATVDECRWEGNCGKQRNWFHHPKGQ